MKLEELTVVETLHHAYIVAGGGSAEVILLLGKRGVSISGNLDLLVEQYEELTIDHVRNTIVPFASLKPIAIEKFCIVSFRVANHHAQNALLKVVEEAPGATHFFLCVDLAGHLLPTLRSRCIIVTATGATTGFREYRSDVLEFLNEGYAKRQVRVLKMISTATRTEDRGPLRKFVEELLSVAHEKHLPPAELRDILDANGYLRLSGSSPKAILGHLAVTLSIIS